MLVDNGNTVVLGGIYQKKRNRTVSKVPFLSEIPFIGALFTSTKTHHKKMEVLIFITPKILQETLTENSYHSGRTKKHVRICDVAPDAPCGLSTLYGMLRPSLDDLDATLPHMGFDLPALVMADGAGTATT